MNSLPGAQLIMPYIYGATWVYDTWISGGAPAVQDRYEDLPRDTLEIMRVAWQASSGNYPVTPYPGTNVFYRGTPPPDDSEVIPLLVDRLGAFTVYVMGRILADPASARTIALGWRGDQMDFFELDAGGAAGRWRVTFDTDASASAFSELLAGNPNISTRLSSRTVVAVVSESGQTPEWLFGPLGTL
jgi:hypothetical protein